MKKVSLLSSLIILLSLLSCRMLFAQATLVERVEPSSNSLNIPYEKWKLPNGLTLIINEDHSDPIVTVLVKCHVGSARESMGKSGFAHLYEHMMFEGSGHIGGKQTDKIVSEVGGQGNANTERDMTTYFETLPSNNLETALWLESDRMGFLLDSITKERFENQRATVKNEKGQNEINRPYGLTEEVMGQALYPVGHPYSWPVIGYSDDLDRVSVQDLRNFYLRWYGPNNAVLTIAGDVNSKEVVALVEKYFGSLKPCPEVKKMRVPEPVLASDKYANYIDNVYAPATIMTYPTVPAYHRDEAALDLLGAMMGQGKNSVFYKNFTKTEKAEASAGHSSSELAGEFSIEVISYPNYDDINPADIPEDKAKRDRWMHELTQKNFNETEKAIHKTIDEFEKAGITDSSLQRAKAKAESDIIQSSTTVFDKAELLANWQTLIGKQYNLQDEMDRVDKVTKDDITRVFDKYIKDKHAAIVNVYPRDPDSKDSTKSYNPTANITLTADPQYDSLKYVKATDNFDRYKRPASGDPKLPVVPQYYTQKLNNGVKIIGTQTSETPSVVLLITIKGGEYVNTDPKKTGVAQLTAELMNEGTKNYTTEQISAQEDLLGSTINFSSAGDRTTINVNSLTKNLDATLKLLEEKLLRPGFNEADFKRVKKQTLEAMGFQKKDAQMVASKLYRNLIYGNTPMGSYATEKNIKKLTLDDVKNYYKQYYSSAAASVVIVGDISQADAMKKLAFLNEWKGQEVKMPDITAFPESQPTQIYVADKEGSYQSVIVVGNLGIRFDPYGDFFKLNAMNFTVGGGYIGSRLMMNLREDKGWTYGAYSYFSGSQYPGTFTVATSVSRPATDSSVTEIMKELNKLKTSGFKDDEVTFTKTSLLNRQALHYESPFQKAGFLDEIQEYDLSKDFTEKQAQILKDMTKDEFNALANKYINPDKMVILIVGNSYLIKNKLAKLGYKVKDIALY